MTANKTELDYVIEQRVKWLSGKLGCSEEEARIIIEMKLTTVEEAKQVIGLNKKEASVASTVSESKPSATKEKTKSKIGEDDLTALLEIIKKHFLEKTFANKDLTPYLKELGLTARQTPSRLKRLAEMGVLVDEGGSPKQYKLS